MTWLENLIAMQDRYTGNIAAVILVGMLFAANYDKIKRRQGEYRILMHLLGNIGLYSLIEMACCILDGMPGVGMEIILYLLNSFLFVVNMELGYGWVLFITFHLSYTIPKRTKDILFSAIIFGLCLLTINVFVPIIFVMKDNGYYKHGPLYFVFMIIAGIYFSYSIAVYIICKRKGGVLKYFPVMMYIVPSLIGIFLEWCLGSSLMSVCNAIAICAVLANMQQEEIFRDRLTGLYNRAYLEEMRVKLEKSKNSFVSGIMLDLNGFKRINDNFGHAEGDQALIIASGLIRESVGSLGDVIRYAGDEFIILLNTWDSEELEVCAEYIQRSFLDFNQKQMKPYQLSVSMGYANFNAETQSVNEFLNMIDKNMYENKKSYYEKSGNNRRKD